MDKTGKEEGHNLDIHMYSFKELLDLFKLDYHFDLNDLKRAKIQVLKTHPDKSKMPSEYFLFYKKAYEVVLNYYMETQKTSKEVPTDEIIYEANNVFQMPNAGNGSIGNSASTNSKSLEKRVSDAIRKMDKNEFQANFNKVFDATMSRPVNTEKNEWFKSEVPIYEIEQGLNKDSMGRALDTLKQKSAAMIIRHDVQELHFNSGAGGSSLYEDDDLNAGGYVTCDPFSKLKFDDLRKVHKDQTVLAVSERDFDKMKTYGSVDEFNRDRGLQDLTPLEKADAERKLAFMTKETQERMLAKQHIAHLEAIKNEEKQKAVIAQFLRLHG